MGANYWDQEWKYLPTPSKMWHKVNFFRQSLTGLNSEFSFSEASYHTKVQQSSLTNYQSINEGRLVGCLPFPSVFVLYKTQPASLRIWTWLSGFISYNDNCNNTSNTRTVYVLHKSVLITFFPNLLSFLINVYVLYSLEFNWKKRELINYCPYCKHLNNWLGRQTKCHLDIYAWFGPANQIVSFIWWGIGISCFWYLFLEFEEWCDAYIQTVKPNWLICLIKNYILWLTKRKIRIFLENGEIYLCM